MKRAKSLYYFDDRTATWTGVVRDGRKILGTLRIRAATIDKVTGECELRCAIDEEPHGATQ